MRLIHKMEFDCERMCTLRLATCSLKSTSLCEEFLLESAIYLIEASMNTSVPGHPVVGEELTAERELGNAEDCAG